MKTKTLTFVGVSAIVLALAAGAFWYYSGPEEVPAEFAFVKDSLEGEELAFPGEEAETLPALIKGEVARKLRCTGLSGEELKNRFAKLKSMAEILAISPESPTILRGTPIGLEVKNLGDEMVATKNQLIVIYYEDSVKKYCIEKVNGDIVDTLTFKGFNINTAKFSNIPVQPGADSDIFFFLYGKAKSEPGKANWKYHTKKVIEAVECVNLAKPEDEWGLCDYEPVYDENKCIVDWQENCETTFEFEKLVKELQCEEFIPLAELTELQAQQNCKVVRTKDKRGCPQYEIKCPEDTAILKIIDFAYEVKAGDEKLDKIIFKLVMQNVGKTPFEDAFTFAYSIPPTSEYPQGLKGHQSWKKGLDVGEIKNIPVEQAYFFPKGKKLELPVTVNIDGVKDYFEKMEISPEEIACIIKNIYAEPALKEHYSNYYIDVENFPEFGIAGAEAAPWNNLKFALSEIKSEEEKMVMKATQTVSKAGIGYLLTEKKNDLALAFNDTIICDQGKDNKLCNITKLYSEEITGTDDTGDYNLYFDVENFPEFGITGTESWNSLKFKLFAIKEKIIVMQAPQNIGLKEQSYIMELKDKIQLIFEGKVICEQEMKEIKKPCVSRKDCLSTEYCKLANCEAETGVCVEVLKECPTLYAPVCGCDGKTYPNECAMELASISKAHDGKCESHDEEYERKKFSKPECGAIGTRSEGWYTGYTDDERIRYDNCQGCEAVCQQIGSENEGWYSSCDGKLIRYDDCGDEACVGLGGIGPNASLGLDDPNKDKKCCEGLKLISPPIASYIAEDGNCVTTEGGGAICAACGDGVCDEQYENQCNCPEDCEKKENCAKEGEIFSRVDKKYPESCCKGLTEWLSGMDTRKVVNGQCVETGLVGGSPMGICINCGNGVCEDIENICNCPEDCQMRSQ